MMDYGVFKPLFGLLLFGAAFAFGIAQLVAAKKARRDAVDKSDARKTHSDASDQ